MAHVFGKSIEFYFTPIVSGEPVSVSSLVSARIYSIAPTTSQIETSAAGSEVERVTIWSDEGDFVKKITFSPLIDTNPHSANAYEKYYVAVNFLFQAAGPEKFASEVIHIYRPDAWQSRIGTTYADLIAIDRTVERLADAGELDEKVRLAREHTILDLEAKGYERRRLFNLEKLNTTVAYKALSLFFLENINDQNRTAERKFEEYEEVYKKRLDSCGVGYDIVGDDKPEADEKIGPGTPVWLVR